MRFIRAGRSLRIRNAAMGSHLWFVLTDPDPTTNKVVIVMLVTERDHTERTVRLDIGDHPFIRHASAVDFRTARYAPSVKLDGLLSSSAAALEADMSASLLQRVRRGLVESSHTANDIVRECRVLFGD